MLKPMSNSRNINSNMHTPDNKGSKNQNLSVVTPQHVSGHKSLHGKSVHPPLDVFNLVKRTHAKLIPRPPQQKISINNKKLFFKTSPKDQPGCYIIYGVGRTEHA